MLTGVTVDNDFHRDGKIFELFKGLEVEGLTDKLVPGTPTGTETLEVRPQTNGVVAAA